MHFIYSRKWLILKIRLSELGPQQPYLFTFHFHNFFFLSRVCEWILFSIVCCISQVQGGQGPG